MTRTAFRAAIQAADRGGTYVVVPAPSVDALGAAGRTSVTGTVDGFAIVGQVMPYSFSGRDRAVVLGLTKSTRAAIGKGIGDDVEVSLERDDRSRSADVEPPEELTAALDADPAAKTVFGRLAPSRRREHARHVADARSPETRVRRAARVLDELRGGG